MKVYCGCKKCGGDADKCFGDMYPGADFEPIKSPETPQADVALNDLLCALVERWEKAEDKHGKEYEEHENLTTLGMATVYGICAEQLRNTIKSI